MCTAVGSRRRAAARAKSFSSLLRSVPGSRIAGNPETKIKGLAYDSRRVEKGWGFICVPGAKADGHHFIPEAIQRGASAVVVESGREAGLEPPPGGAIGVVPDSREAMAWIATAFHDEPSSQLVLVGVTGTNGKTTTALMLDAIFAAAGYRSGVIGTLEYRIGSRRLKPLHTTPEAVDLQALLASLVAEGASHAAMEVSSHALALHRVLGCWFSAAVFTNLTPEHLDFHQDMGQYLEAKRKLFEDPVYLPAEGERANAVNTDDEAGRSIAARALGRTITFGFGSHADCRAEAIELGPDGTRFAAVLPGGAGQEQIETRLVGEVNVYNALGALAACVGLGIPVEAAREGLRTMPPVTGRFERVRSRKRTVLVDYAHTPDGLRRALETARQLSRKRVIVVFGCGGDRDSSKRPVMGEIASRLADRCVITSDNPRSERPEAIIEQIVAGVPMGDRGKCAVEPDRQKAIRLAIQEAGKDDVVLIAGKGHEDYQIFADRTIHFDDREVAEAVLREIEGDRGG